MRSTELHCSTLANEQGSGGNEREIKCIHQTHSLRFGPLQDYQFHTRMVTFFCSGEMARMHLCSIFGFHVDATDVSLVGANLASYLCEDNSSNNTITWWDTITIVTKFYLIRYSSVKTKVRLPSGLVLQWHSTLRRSETLPTFASHSDMAL